MVESCPRCGGKLPKNAKFCIACGEAVESNQDKQKSPVHSGPRAAVPDPKKRWTLPKRPEYKTVLRIVVVCILITGVILVFSIVGAVVMGMPRDLSPSTSLPTPVPTTHASQIPTLTVTLTPTSSDQYCAINYPGTSYNSISRRCEQFASIPAPQSTVGTVHPATTTSPVSSDMIYRNYSWNYHGTTWKWNGGFPKSGYAYYKNRPHNRENNYAEYALSDYDRELLQGIVQKFKDGGDKNGYTATQNVLNIVTFVQSLPYTSDKVTTGYDEYPRYPLETLVDNGGDCEDTAILTAALVHEMGYEVVLLHLPGHMAVGINVPENLPGTYYQYLGLNYYYLETTGDGWGLGVLPAEFKNQEVNILPLIQQPRMDMNCQSTLEDENASFVWLHQYCDIENIGVGTAKNPKMYFAALALDAGAGMVWKPDPTVPLNDYSEGGKGYAETTLKIPRNQSTQIMYELYGDNFETVKLLSQEFTA